MNWYIAICSLVTGFFAGCLFMKHRDEKHLEEGQQEIIKQFIEMSKGHNASFQRLFDINREVLSALIREGQELKKTQEGPG